MADADLNMDAVRSAQQEGLHEAGRSDDLRALARELLEFPAIVEQLAGRTRFFLSRELALAVVPQARVEDVERLQEETAEARVMLDTVGDIGLGGTEDPRPLLRRAALGGMLSGAELMRIVYLVEAVRLARSVVKSVAGDVPLLESLVEDIPDLHELTDRLRESLAENGDVVDGATPRLGPLRRGVAREYRRLTRLLERMANRPAIRLAIQSTSIATRGDRLVLEVKSERRSEVPGIVHDVSNSGATIFVEPFAAVEPCNRWREVAAEAQREEERVLRRLSRIAGSHEQEIRYALDAAAALDLIVARARLAASMDCIRAATLPERDEAAVRLLGARHPLLGKSEAVPVNISIGPAYRGLVITGPNTGGKTVALKTVGLFALMHQSGMQLPALTGTALAVFDGVYADIGDAQSIERSVSTFSSHMGNVVRIVRRAGPRSLALLDELGTGTDPDEGAALAMAVLAHLVDRGVATAITTHHRTVAEFASSLDGAMNASVELEPSTMLPTYQVLMGVPGRSYALSVAERLGLPEPLLESAHSFLDDKHVKAETLLNELQSERNALREAAAKAHEELAAAEAARAELEKGLASVVRKQEDLVERTRAELRREADAVRKSLRRALSDAKRGAAPAEAQRAVSRIRKQVGDPTWFPIAGIDEARGMAKGKPASTRRAVEERPLMGGDLVEIKGLNVKAEVVEAHRDGTADLRMGNSRIRLSQSQLRLVEEAAERAEEPGPTLSVDAPGDDRHAGRLDIRGYRVAEAEDEVARFIDRCVLDGVERCEVLHGTGTGALREAVREMLAAMPGVVGFRPAPSTRGGNGVTIVELGGE